MHPYLGELMRDHGLTSEAAWSTRGRRVITLGGDHGTEYEPGNAAQERTAVLKEVVRAADPWAKMRTGPIRSAEAVAFREKLAAALVAHGVWALRSDPDRIEDAVTFTEGSVREVMMSMLCDIGDGRYDNTAKFMARFRPDLYPDGVPA